MDFNGISRRVFLKWLALANIFIFVSNNKTSYGQKILRDYAHDSVNEGTLARSQVLRIHSSKVIPNANFVSDPYLDSIRDNKLEEMLGEGVKEFTQQKNLRTAWLDILTNYKKGDKVAIKPNFNFLNHGYKFTITSPQLINSVLKQLIETVGVNPQEIFLYDLCKKIPNDIVRSRISYPINYVESMDSKTIVDKILLRLYYGLASADLDEEIKMRESIIDKNGSSVKCYIPKVITQAQHLINMPLLTNHIFIANSGSLKNHYGTVRFSNFHSYPGVLHGGVLNKAVVDINSNHHIKNKTRIIIADGLFGVYDRGDSNEGGKKKPWRTFNNDLPRSIFMSKDPVAIDSVMASIIIKERKSHKLNILSTEYLRDAMDSRLGIHEISEKDIKFTNIQYSTLSL